MLWTTHGGFKWRAGNVGLSVGGTRKSNGHASGAEKNVGKLHGQVIDLPNSPREFWTGTIEVGTK